MGFNPDEQLTPHFRLVEFLHYGSTQGLTTAIYQNIKALANRLEVVRRLCGNRPIRILSGFRTPAHNKEVGGASQSYHLVGKAADIYVVGLSPKQVQKALADWD